MSEWRPDRYTGRITSIMESSTPPSAQVAKPLNNFETIGHNTYVYTPEAYLSTRAPTTPLLLLFSWNAAAAKHIAKYTIAYQRLFPTSRIILVRCFTGDMFRRTSAYSPLLAPAMDLVAEHTQAGGEVLVHSFSNGGGNQVNEFAKAWKKKYGTVMPMRLQVLDSSPTKAPWMKSHRAIMLSLPKNWFFRLFGSALIHMVLAATFVIWTATRRENKGVLICRELNDEKLFDKHVPRVYLYSLADDLVGPEEVEEHAGVAEKKGWEVTRVKFEKSAHCGHLREDEAKYWNAIMEAWKNAAPKQQ
jgi:hypothetical protein